MANKDNTTQTSMRDLKVSAEGEHRAAYVIVIKGDEAGRIYQLRAEVTIMGRANDADIRFTDSGVSRYHAQLEVKGDGIEIVDTDSRNGTFCNGAETCNALIGCQENEPPDPDDLGGDHPGKCA